MSIASGPAPLPPDPPIDSPKVKPKLTLRIGDKVSASAGIPDVVGCLGAMGCGNIGTIHQIDRSDSTVLVVYKDAETWYSSSHVVLVEAAKPLCVGDFVVASKNADSDLCLGNWDSGAVGTIVKDDRGAEQGSDDDDIYDESSDDDGEDDATPFRVIYMGRENWYRKQDLIRSEVVAAEPTVTPTPMPTPTPTPPPPPQSAEDIAFMDFMISKAELDETDAVAVIKCLRDEFKARSVDKLKKLNEDEIKRVSEILGLKKIPADDLLEAFQKLKTGSDTPPPPPVGSPQVWLYLLALFCFCCIFLLKYELRSKHI